MASVRGRGNPDLVLLLGAVAAVLAALPAASLQPELRRWSTWPAPPRPRELLALAPVALAGLVLAYRSAPPPRPSGAWTTVALLPLLFVLGWLMPPPGEPAGLVPGLLPIGVALGFGILLSDPRGRAAIWPGSRAAAMSLRLVAAPTAGLAVLVLALGQLGGATLEGGALARALVTYPLYALAQLALLLALPDLALARLGVPPRRRIAVVAALFALAHAPNPGVMALTGLGMLGWAAAFRRCPVLLGPAVSMGVLGSLVTQALPPGWTGQMRVGPSYVRAAWNQREEEAWRRLTESLRGRELPRGEGFVAAVAPELPGGLEAPGAREFWARASETLGPRRALTALLESEDVRPRAPGTKRGLVLPGPVRVHLDAVRWRDGALQLHGWATEGTSGLPPRRLLVLAGGEQIPASRRAVPRPDLARLGALQEPGFALLLEPATLVGREDARLRVFAEWGPDRISEAFYPPGGPPRIGPLLAPAR